MADETNVTTQGATSAPDAGQSAQTDSAQQNQPDLDALIQRAVDRATNKLGNENKALRKQVEDMRKSKMTDDEARQAEMQEKEKELADRAKALTDRENKLFALRQIKDAGLDDGSDSATSFAIAEFVMADTEDAIKERVKAFGALIDKVVKNKVDGVFKANGRTPAVGTDSNQPQTSVAVRLGKSAADANAKARSTLDHYIGGNKR